MFFGIDLTSSERRPSACVCLNKELDIVFQGFLYTDSEIIASINKLLPEVIAIDAPLSIPSGYCCLDEACACHLKSSVKGRACERELARMGIPCYFTTKRSIIKEMVVRGIALRRGLEKLGYVVIEVYPFASKVRLFGKPIPRKTRSEGLLWLREKVKELTDSRDVCDWSHDLCDAAMATYTGILYSRGDIDVMGDEEEGLLYIPKNSCGRKETC